MNVGEHVSNLNYFSQLCILVFAWVNVAEQISDLLPKPKVNYVALRLVEIFRKLLVMI